jgi:hypothetical protein
MNWMTALPKTKMSTVGDHLTPDSPHSQTAIMVKILKERMSELNCTVPGLKTESLIISQLLIKQALTPILRDPKRYSLM